MNKTALMIPLCTLVAGAALGAGVAYALTNDQLVEKQVDQASASLAQGNSVLAQTVTSTNAPGTCVNRKVTPAACAAVVALDEAQQHAFDTIHYVDAIESDGGEVAAGRRLGRIAWSAAANASMFGIISPELSGIISPEFAGIISPELAGIISPELAASVEATAGIISPELTGIISPEHTAELVGIISPEYQQLNQTQKAAIAAEAYAIAARAENDLILAAATVRAVGYSY